MSNAVSKLDDFIGLDDFHPQVKTSFPTINSLKWFVRVHRDELVKHGVLIVVAGRLKIHPVKFEAAVIEAGQKAAA